MAPGNPFLYRDEDDDDDLMPIPTSDQDMSQNIGNDDDVTNLKATYQSHLKDSPII